MKRLVNIQILRACAALMIVVYHAGLESTKIAHQTGQPPLFDDIVWSRGVDIFFVLSGFIMVLAYASRFGCAGAPRSFMRRRQCRIIPLYWLLTTVALCGALIVPRLVPFSQLDELHVLSSYAFWPYARAPGDIRPVLTLGWTLNLEMFFYVLFAVAMRFPLRRGLLLLTAVLVSLMLWRANSASPPTPVRFWGDPIALTFLLGIAIGLAFRAGIRISITTTAILLTVGFAALLVVRIDDGSGSDLASRLASVVPASLIVAAGALAQKNGQGVLVRGAVAVGDASYSLYLIHQFVFYPLQAIWVESGTVLPLWSYPVVAGILSVLISVIVYRLVERPLLRWLNRSNPMAGAPRLQVPAEPSYLFGRKVRS